MTYEHIKMSIFGVVIIICDDFYFQSGMVTGRADHFAIHKIFLISI